jgi:hypothetical protein
MCVCVRVPCASVLCVCVCVFVCVDRGVLVLKVGEVLPVCVAYVCEFARMWMGHE